MIPQVQGQSQCLEHLEFLEDHWIAQYDTVRPQTYRWGHTRKGEHQDLLRRGKQGQPSSP